MAGGGALYRMKCSLPGSGMSVCLPAHVLRLLRRRPAFVGAQTAAAAAWSMVVCLQPESPLLHYALVFLVIALIAAGLGFGGLAASAAGIAKLLFVVFVVLAVVSFVWGLLRRG